VQLFLNAKLADSVFATKKRRNGDISSLWTDVQRHLQMRGLAFETRPDAAHDDAARLHLRVPHHRKWLEHKTVARHVKLHGRLGHKNKWADMVDQGKTVRAHGGAGSKFVTTASGLRDEDYRFVVQARLNQVDTNAVLKRRRLRAHGTCRAPNCTTAETLAHVLNHCASNMDAIRQRHDSALVQIEAAIRRACSRPHVSTELRVNQTVPEYTGAALRPDLVLRDTARTNQQTAPPPLRCSRVTITRQPSTSRSRLSCGSRGGACTPAPSSTARSVQYTPATSCCTQRSWGCSREMRAGLTPPSRAIASERVAASGTGTVASTGCGSTAAPVAVTRAGLGGPRSAPHLQRHGDTGSRDRQGTILEGHRPHKPSQTSDTSL
jgi:hypothetical protein